MSAEAQRILILTIISDFAVFVSVSEARTDKLTGEQIDAVYRGIRPPVYKQ